MATRFGDCEPELESKGRGADATGDSLESAGFFRKHNKQVPSRSPFDKTARRSSGSNEGGGFE
eukprot:CAMPEP_0184506258 /NCGR_PEP_ID=MMETSP0113_2-20130426/53405_1 /TAXON_ID=91329 /ORGANISM="Norrisiella sphaerica, Strain BC52" /LENGTH=62 /DNA_ID=CAMNT_0026895971 /DNA_START=678 /DNA_END=866 /DNA_ORIENTATION=+